MILKSLLTMATKTLIVLTALVSFSACNEPWEDHKLKKGQAKELIDRYNQNSQSKNNPPRFFSRDDIEYITSGSTGVRYYYGQQVAEQFLVLVATREPSSIPEEHDDDESKIIVSPKFQNDSRIDPDDASALTQEYQANNGGRPKGGFFLIGIFDYVKGAPGFSGMNFYFGQDAGGKITIVGKATRFDSSTNTHVDIDGADARDIDMSVPCPDNCGSRNRINHER